MNQHLTEEDRCALDMLREVIWDVTELRDGMQMWEYDSAFRAAVKETKECLRELILARREQ